MYSIVWFFFCYAFLGWCAEVSFAALTLGRFVNRGFLNSPMCPIYGFGALIVLYCLVPLQDNMPLLFLGSVLLTSVLELLTGQLLEKLFHQRWWDYSDKPFHLGRYVCLEFSLMWGVACVIVVKALHPLIRLGVFLIPRTLSLLLLGILCAITVVDVIATVHTIGKINRKLGQIEELAEKIRAGSDEIGESLAEHVIDAAQRHEQWKDTLGERKQQLEQRCEQLRERLEQTLNQRTFGQKRLLDAFPNMRSTHHVAALERLRAHTQQRRRQKK